MSSICNLDINYLWDVWGTNISSHSASCIFILLCLLLCRNFSIWCSYVVNFAFVAFVFGVISKNHCHCEDRYQGAFSLSFILGILWFQITWKSLPYFELIFVSDIRKGSYFILLHVGIPFSQQHLFKSVSFPPCVFLAPLSNISLPYMHSLFFLASQLSSMELCFCFNVSTMCLITIAL